MVQSRIVDIVSEIGKLTTRLALGAAKKETLAKESALLVLYFLLSLSVGSDCPVGLIPVASTVCPTKPDLSAGSALLPLISLVVLLGVAVL